MGRRGSRPGRQMSRGNACWAEGVAVPRPWGSREPGEEEQGGPWLQMSPETASEEGADLTGSVAFVKALTLDGRSLGGFFEQRSGINLIYFNRIPLAAAARKVWGGGGKGRTLCN